MDVAPKLHIHSIIHFNNYTKEWKNPTPPKPGTKHVVVLIDISGSMKAHTDELRLLVSLLKALAGHPEDMPNIPMLNGGTNLVGALRELFKDKMPTEKQTEHDNTRPTVITITDGFDNYERIVSLATGWEEDNKTPIMTSFTANITPEQRMNYVLQHMTNYLNLEVILVGIGELVTQMYNMAMRLPVTAVALIDGLDKDADEEDKEDRDLDICNAVVGAITAPPRNQQSSTDRAKAVFRTSRRPGRSKRKNPPAIQVSDEMVTQAKKGRQAVVIDTSPKPAVNNDMTAENWRKAVDKVTQNLGLHPKETSENNLWALKFTRAALLWLLRQSAERNDQALPGGLIGGKRTSIIDSKLNTIGAQPTMWWKKTFNSMLSMLKHNNLLDSHTVADFTFVHQGKSLQYTKSPAYAATPATKKAILAVYNDDAQDWALPQAEFLAYTDFKPAAESSEPMSKRAKTDA